MIWTLHDWLNNFAAFLYQFMALCIDLIHICSHRNEMCCQLPPKKTFYLLYIANKTEHFSLKMGASYMIYVAKRLNED